LTEKTTGSRVGDVFDELVSEARLIEEIGPWPFISRKTFLRPDGVRVVLHSRHHRKGLFLPEPGEFLLTMATLRRCLWMPGRLNWWIGSIFALGSILFALGAALSLSPTLARDWSLDTTAVNAIYFAGSIPFTTAGYLQLFQTANAPSFSSLQRSASRRFTLFGWRPSEIGWLSCALQFVGTLLFNLNTFDAMLPGLDWLRQDWLIWAPDFGGSILFLVSGYLAFVETSHAHGAWQPTSLSWWVTLVNLLGCVGFMISAVFAFVPSQSPGFPTISVGFTLIGALGFLVGSLLMLPEAALEPSQPDPQ
jgi:hypothetical protein